MSEAFLSIDQGGQSTRVLAFDSAGRRLASASAPVATTSPGTGRFEQDPDGLVDSVVRGLEEAAASLPPDIRLRAGLATQRSSVVCWDRDTGRALTPVLSWRDTRNAPWIASLKLDPARIRRITGLRPSAHYGASKLRWCLDHCPAVAAAMDEGRLAWGPLASFLVFRLTRERTLAADPVNASRTLLMDLDSRDWSEQMLDAFGLPADPLPPVSPENAPFGTLTVGSHPVPLVRCTGDQPAAMFADGPPEPATAVVNAGTGAFVLQPAPWPNGEDRLLTSVIRGEDGLSFALEGTVNGAGAALAAESAAAGIGDWTEAVAGLDEGATLPIYLNGRSGLGSPWWRESFPSGLVGAGSHEARMGAVLESIVFMLVVNLRAIAGHVERQTRIRASGGLSRSDRFCRALADLSGLAVDRPLDTEATARGLAWLGSGGGDEWVRTPLVAFVPRHNPGLVSRFDRWQGCMEEALASDHV